MKKILLVAPYCNLPGEPYFNRFSYIAIKLSKKYNVTLLTSRYSHFEKKHRERNDKFKIKNLQLELMDEPGYRKNVSFSRLYSHTVFCNNLESYLQKTDRPDLIYSAYPLIKSNIILSSFAQKNNIPFVIDIQDNWPHSIYSALPFLNKEIFKFLFKPFIYRAKKAFANADFLISVSNTYQEYVKNNLNVSLNSDVVYIGADIALIDQINTNSNYLETSNTFRCVYIGTISHSYDINTLVTAFSKLDKKNVNTELLIIGDGPHRMKVQRYAENLSASNVKFLGSMPYDQMISIIKTCNVALNPIRKGAAQSVTNKISDYFCTGLPVLSCQENKEVRDLIESNAAGCFYEPGDSSDLANKIVELNSDAAKLQKMANSSRCIGENNFDRNITYKRIFKTIDKLLNADD
ncbi:glycosyltransferase family 4 protein [Endozoicomonas lisbonensis]|uniref:Glycosyltransferase involved in cell wall biosynthesis n=1 Tax=Endozoicomonas lisbonensis TaxID=3120522 RepID=A0ABV2SBF2_9GAMM